MRRKEIKKREEVSWEMEKLSNLIHGTSKFTQTPSNHSPCLTPDRL